MKNETSISENLAREVDTPIKIGVGDQLLKQIFISKHISLKVRLCYFSVNPASGKIFSVFGRLFPKQIFLVI